MSVPDPKFVSLLAAWDTWLFTGALVVGLPCFAYFCLFKGSRGQGFFSRLSKSATYLSIAACLWAMLLFLAVVAHCHRLSMEDLGLHWHNPSRTSLITAILFLVLAAVSWLDFWKHSRMPLDELRTRLAKLSHFFPYGRSEIIAFFVMAVSAGICEEILYRGWLLNLVGALTGSMWLGLALSSIAFGLGHAYQGPLGILSTGFVGLLLGLVFVWIGSLVPVQILHAFINLSSGLMCAYLLARLNRTTPQATTFDTL